MKRKPKLYMLVEKPKRYKSVGELMFSMGASPAMISRALNEPIEQIQVQYLEKAIWCAENAAKGLRFGGGFPKEWLREAVIAEKWSRETGDWRIKKKGKQK